MIGFSRKKTHVLTGLEIGTASVKVVIGELLPDDALVIRGVGETGSLRRVCKGEIADARLIKDQVQIALGMAEKHAGVEIGHLFLAVSGGHIRSETSLGQTMIGGAERAIEEEDVIHAASNARAYTLPSDKKILHFLDRRYVVDDMREVSKPIGLVGSKLETDVLVVFGQHNRIETSCRLVEDILGYPPTDVAYSAVAAAMAALSPDDTDNGVLLLDIGAGITEYVVCTNSGWYHSGQITVGCEHLVNDLAIGLRLSEQKCRHMLKELESIGAASMMTPDARRRVLEVAAPNGATREIPVSTVEKIIELRLQELFECIRNDLRRQQLLERIGTGVRICGGGALLPRIDQLARHVFSMPVHRARPRLVSGDQSIVQSPRFMAPLGLIRWGKMMMDIDAQGHVPFFEQLQMDTRQIGLAIRRAFRW